MGEILRARKLLDVNAASIPVDISKDMSPLRRNGGSFDPNLVVILVALLCALICALAINYIIRWAFRCTQLVLGREVPPIATAAAAPPPPPENNKGLKRAAVQTLPTLTYAKPPNVELDCPICLADFADGETVRVLPKCNHSFHRQCIDRWLSSHSSCPTCRQNLLDVIAEKKGVATLLCSYQHTHACAQNGSIRIIIHQASEQQETGQTSHSEATPAAAMDQNSETPETQTESAEIPNQRSDA